jgi:hypothetical protein
VRVQSTVDDPLRPLGKVAKPDERQVNFVASLASIHAELSELVLHGGVPIAIR